MSLCRPTAVVSTWLLPLPTAPRPAPANLPFLALSWIYCYAQMLELGKLQQLVGAPYSSCASQEC